jgi:hypothetical protein
LRTARSVSCLGPAIVNPDLIIIVSRCRMGIESFQIQFVLDEGPTFLID